MSESVVSGRVRAGVAALLAGGLVVAGLSAWRVDASGGGEDSTYVPVTPCRLFDTRSGPDNVGSRSTPVGAGVAGAHVQQVTGVNGDCEVPVGAVGVSLNVTVVNGSAQSNLRLYPEGVEPPLASNLNWIAGQAPTPNKVDVALSGDGRVVVQNFKGTVDVIADVVGYSTRASLDDIEARLAALEQAAPDAGRDDSGSNGNGVDNSALERRLADLEAAHSGLEEAYADLELAYADLELASSDLAERQQELSVGIGLANADITRLRGRTATLEQERPFVESAMSSSGFQLPDIGPSFIIREGVVPDADGLVTIDWHATVQSEHDGGQVRCGLFSEETPPSQISLVSVGAAHHTADDADRITTLSASRTFRVFEDETDVWAVYCDQIGGSQGDTWIWGRGMTVTFIADR
ncbi:MAG: hypothetical protein AAFY28_03330 [Actinomycetota bacterium]